MYNNYNNCYAYGKLTCMHYNVIKLHRQRVLEFYKAEGGWPGGVCACHRFLCSKALCIVRYENNNVLLH